MITAVLTMHGQQELGCISRTFSVALALGACMLLRRSIGIDCSRKTTSQTLCASELPRGLGYVSRYPQNLGHTLSPEKEVRIGLAAVREGPRTQDKAERLMVSFVIALLHERGHAGHFDNEIDLPG